MPQITLNQVKRPCDVARWFYQMAGVIVDFKTRQDDIIYVSMLFNRHPGGVSDEERQQFAYALYLAHLENGMTTCRYFKGVGRALNFREMILSEQHKKEVKKHAEKSKAVNLKRQQRLMLKKRLKDRKI
jgi:hypothetical protein